jgi:LysM repeat protein
MPKSAVTSSQQARSGSKSPAGSVKSAAPKKIKVLIRGLKGTRIDPRVAEVLASDTLPTKAMTVMVKLNPRASQYAHYSVSNVSGNERGRVFQAEVEEIVKRTVAETGESVKLISSMPNVGVAKVQAQPGALRTLLEDEKIVGVQLAAG